MDRKEFLRSLGVITAGATFLGAEDRLRAAGKMVGMGTESSPASSSSSASYTDPELDFPVKPLKANVKNGPVKVIVIGAGNRGRDRKSTRLNSSH